MIITDIATSKICRHRLIFITHYTTIFRRPLYLAALSHACRASGNPDLNFSEMFSD